MTDRPLTLLPNLTNPALTDIAYLVADPSGAKTPSKATVQAIQNSMTGFVAAVNVKAYGAVGNGIVDDSAAFQAALTAHPNEAVFCPSATYRLNTGLLISGSLIAQPGTILDYRGSGPAIILGNPAFVPPSGIWTFRNQLSDFLIDGSNALAGASGIQVIGANHFSIERVKASGFATGAGFHLYNYLVGGTLRDCLSYGNQYGILATTPGTIPVFINIITIEGGEFQGNGIGVAFIGSIPEAAWAQMIIIDHTIIEGCTTYTAQFDQVISLHLRNCWFEANVGGVRIGAIDCWPYMATIKDCKFYSMATGIEVVQGVNVLVDENIFEKGSEVAMTAVLVHGGTVSLADNYIGAGVTLRVDA